MLLHRYFMVVICGVFIASRAVSGEGEMRAVGGQVSFKLDNIGSPVTSITWKHVTPGSTVKAIEWEDGEGTTTPNPRFKDITKLNIENGQITITNLRVEHSGVYTIDVSGKEQTQKRFTLTVMNRVPKPVIEVEKVNLEVVYLSCKNYNGTITWSNSAGEKLAYQSNKESITVQKNEGNPENSYTCKLENAVSEETSDPVHKKNLFQAESTKGGPWWIVFIIIPISLVIGSVPLYKFNDKFKKLVDDKCPCIKVCVDAIRCPCTNSDDTKEGYSLPQGNDTPPQSNGGKKEDNKNVDEPPNSPNSVNANEETTELV